MSHRAPVSQSPRQISARSNFPLRQARKNAGLPTLSPDDVWWIFKLYPNASTASGYGSIRDDFFSDGVWQAQGAN